MFDKNDIVRLKDSSLTGYIEKIFNDKCEIIIKDKKITTDIQNVELVEKYHQIKNNCKNKNQNINYEKEKVIINFPKEYTKNVEPELMIRHKKYEEAMFDVDMYIHSAYDNNIKQVKIIHGKHGGILRDAVHKYLQNNPLIESYRLGNYFEGSYGVTIVTLKTHS